MVNYNAHPKHGTIFALYLSKIVFDTSKHKVGIWS